LAVQEGRELLELIYIRAVTVIRVLTGQPLSVVVAVNLRMRLMVRVLPVRQAEQEQQAMMELLVEMLIMPDQPQQGMAGVAVVEGTQIQRVLRWLAEQVRRGESFLLGRWRVLTPRSWLAAHGRRCLQQV
jgi:hypothetical protein